MRSILLPAVCIVLALSAAPVSAQQPTSNPASVQIEWIDLTDDMSRSDLASFEVLKFGPPADKNVRRMFVFPKDANDGIYGIDVSHHNGVVDWQAMEKSGVKFAYMKASQGDRFRDPRFATNWKSTGTNIRRGAYHFLTADKPGKDQAKAYLAVLEAAGGLKPEDLAPVVDLEWDFVKQGGKQVDRWETLTPEQIVQVVSDFTAEVKAATGRIPIIYTAASWWNARIKGNQALKAHPHWIADYRATSIKNKAPQSVKQHAHVVWQFTDSGMLDGFARKFDVNKLNGASLDRLLGKPVP